MNNVQLVVTTALTMVAFAGNSILCRMALKDTSIDAQSYTTVRIVSGAVVLLALVLWHRKAPLARGSWRSAVALLFYAVCLSFAYRSINAGAGALMLFCAVQLTMILMGYIAGERMQGRQIMGFIAAMAGFVLLVFPKVQPPSLIDSGLMLASGVAWGIYSLLGRGQADPVGATAGNFLRASPLTIVLSVLALPWMNLDARGVFYAVLSGALASGMGYVLWYRVLQHMRAMTASTVQLLSPLIATLGGVALLGESLTRELLIASLLILGGIWLVVRFDQR